MSLIKQLNKYADSLKWTATIVLIIGTGINAYGLYPMGPIILIFGGNLWLIVSVVWKEPALIITNFSMVMVGIIGLLLNL